MPSGSAVETMTARLAPIARWSSFSLSSQPACQCRVFLVSQTIVPQTRSAASRTSCTRSAPRAPFATGTIEVLREAARELGLDVDLQHLALALLRALLALAPRLFERMAQIVDQLVLLLELQILLLGEAAAQGLLQALLLAVDPARHFEIELARAVFERALFLAQFELGLLRDLALAALLGELSFEELLFQGEIRARLLFGLAGEHLRGAPRSRGETAPAALR